MTYVVREVDGEFVLPIEGFVCSEMRDGGELILRNSTDEVWITGSRFTDDLIRQLVEREARVVRAVATHDSTLQIAFDDGASVVNPPADEVEAWEVRGPGRVLVVAVPDGGEPAIWDATSEIRTIRLGEPLPAEVEEMNQAYGLQPTGDFEFRLAAGRRVAIELHPPDAPALNRSNMIRFVPPVEQSSSSRSPWWRRRG